MTNYAPMAAAVGTLILLQNQKTGQLQPVPVVAWAFDSNEAVPLTPCDIGSDYFAVEMPNGTVFDPSERLTFHTRAAFEAWHRGETDPSPAVVAAHGNGIQFNPKQTYKRKSYWKFDDGKRSFVFEVPEEESTPRDDRIEKITREDFFKLRKEIAVAKLDELRAGGEGPGADAPDLGGDEGDDPEAEDLL